MTFFAHIPVFCLIMYLTIIIFFLSLSQPSRTPSPLFVFFYGGFLTLHLVAAKLSVNNYPQLCNHAPPGLLSACTESLPSCTTPYTANRNRKWQSLGRWKEWETPCSRVQPAERKIFRWLLTLEFRFIAAVQFASLSAKYLKALSADFSGISHRPIKVIYVTK